MSETTKLSVFEILGMVVRDGEWCRADGNDVSSVSWNDAAKMAMLLHPLAGKTICPDAVNDAVEYIEANGGTIALKIIDPILAIAREAKAAKVRQEKIESLMEAEDLSEDMAARIVDMMTG